MLVRDDGYWKLIQLGLLDQAEIQTRSYDTFYHLEIEDDKYIITCGYKRIKRYTYLIKGGFATVRYLG